MDKKLVLPGDHLSSAEESEPGDNTYSQNDEVYSAGAGEDASVPGKAEVRPRGRTLRQPQVGMPVYCVIIKAGLNKAIGGCIPADEAEGGKRGVEFEAVLPVTAIRTGYVRDLRDEVKIGDIVKAKIQKAGKAGFEITMFGHECGVVCAFCPKCRSRMGLQDRIYICPKCFWKERRKLPLAEGEAPPPEPERRERFPRREFRGGERGGDRGGRFRGHGGGGGDRRRGFGRRPGPGGREGSF
jgi:exosome complex component CSL4